MHSHCSNLRIYFWIILLRKGFITAQLFSSRGFLNVTCDDMTLTPGRGSISTKTITLVGLHSWMKRIFVCIIYCVLMWIILLYNLTIALQPIFATVASLFDPCICA